MGDDSACIFFEIWYTSADSRIRMRAKGIATEMLDKYEHHLLTKKIPEKGGDPDRDDDEVIVDCGSYCDDDEEDVDLRGWVLETDVCDRRTHDGHVLLAAGGDGRAAQDREGEAALWWVRTMMGEKTKFKDERELYMSYEKGESCRAVTCKPERNTLSKLICFRNCFEPGHFLGYSKDTSRY